MCLSYKEDAITEANRRAREELNLGGVLKFFKRDLTMRCEACDEDVLIEDLNDAGVCPPCWERYESVKELLEWTHLGGDLEGKLGEDGLVELRIRGGSGTELFISEEALHNAIGLYDADTERPTLGHYQTDGYNLVYTGKHSAGVMSFAPSTTKTITYDECAVCGDTQEYGCKCPRSDRSCKNGHSWHTCVKHKKRVNGESDHTLDMSMCTCL